MLDKYYTPEIEEFYEGFEFESVLEIENLFKKYWVSDVYPSAFIEIECRKNLIKYLHNKNIRVKYLDKEDIESLGFYLNHRFEDKLLFVNCNDFSTIVDSSNKIIEERALKLYTLILESNQTVTIRGWLHYDPIFFQGIIKNKSELKQILKMIQ